MFWMTIMQVCIFHNSGFNNFKGKPITLRQCEYKEDLSMLYNTEADCLKSSTVRFHKKLGCVKIEISEVKQ